MRQSVARVWVAGLIVVAAVGALDAQATRVRRTPRDLSVYTQQYAKLRERFVAAIEELAAQEAENGRDEEAQRLRELTRPVDSQSIRFAPLPRTVQPELPADLMAEGRFREAQVRKHQSEFAKSLYLLSRQALHAGHLGYAYDLVRETAAHDPDHASARKVLGFVRLGDEWLSPFEADAKRAGRVWHSQFGWIQERDIPRYERGERLYKGNRWVSASKDAELHKDFLYAWEIRTEHFLVKTNHSLEKGVELAKQLEDFHGLCRQTLAGFFFNPEQLQQLFEGKTESRIRKYKPLEVHYYRNRDEYLARLKQLTNQPVEITKGMYFPTTEVAYFFYDPKEKNESTLFHEATHLLLSGSRPASGIVAQKGHFWIVEGIACYMESFQQTPAGMSVGDPTNERIRAAQHHLVVDKYYVPLAEFADMGLQAFQSAREIRKNYSQAAAVSHFFMHYDGGKYRDSLIEHLSQIYSSQERVRLNPDTLPDLTGMADVELDREYVEYLKNLNTRPQAAPEPATP